MNTLTRDAYAEVGLELLAGSGIAAVTIAAVCRRLLVTKGSFYHHFSAVSDLHGAMLEHWENVYGVERPAAIEGLPPLQRLDATIDASLDRNHDIESALRAW